MCIIFLIFYFTLINLSNLDLVGLVLFKYDVPFLSHRLYGSSDIDCMFQIKKKQILLLLWLYLRNDLNPENGTYPIAAMGHRSHGATDVKITTSLHFQKLMFIAIAGPTQGTNNSLGPFCWSKSDFDDQVSHFGQPDCFDFGPTMHQWGHQW